MRRLIALVMLLTLAAGCRSIAGYGSASPQGDGARDLASPLDGGGDDTVTPRDGGPKDAPSPDASVPDHGTDAQLSPDVGLADLVPPLDTLFHGEAGSCYEKEQVVQAGACPAQRLGCGTALPLDGDCDGLPDQLDPDPTCNTLAVNQTFSSGLTGWEGFNPPYLGCGVELTSGVFSSTTKFPTGNNVWLLGLRYTSDPYVGSAKITLSKQVAPNQHYAACVLRAVSSQLELKTEVWTPAKPKPLGAVSAAKTTALAQGAYFTLAAWAEGTRFICAVHDEAGAELLRAIYDHDTPITADAQARIGTNGVSAWLDHVRVFLR